VIKNALDKMPQAKPKRITSFVKGVNNARADVPHAITSAIPITLNYIL